MPVCYRQARVAFYNSKMSGDATPEFHSGKQMVFLLWPKMGVQIVEAMGVAMLQARAAPTIGTVGCISAAVMGIWIHPFTVRSSPDAPSPTPNRMCR